MLNVLTDVWLVSYKLTLCFTLFVYLNCIKTSQFTIEYVASELDY